MDNETLIATYYFGGLKVHLTRSPSQLRVIDDDGEDLLPPSPLTRQARLPDYETLVADLRQTGLTLE